MYKIIDWAGNILCFDKIFKKPNLAVAMKFDNFEDGWEYIWENFSEDYHCEFYVVEIQIG